MKIPIFMTFLTKNLFLGLDSCQQAISLFYPVLSWADGKFELLTFWMLSYSNKDFWPLQQPILCYHPPVSSNSRSVQNSVTHQSLSNTHEAVSQLFIWTLQVSNSNPHDPILLFFSQIVGNTNTEKLSSLYLYLCIPVIQHGLPPGFIFKWHPGVCTAQGTNINLYSYKFLKFKNRYFSP